jgi:hypothetical protein
MMDQAAGPVPLENLDAVWETSRHNAWSYGLPLVLNIGTAIFIVLAFVPQKWLRWTLNLIALFAIGFFAVDYSSKEIEEKWRIRNEWIQSNHDSLTNKEHYAGTIDGSNRVLGPILIGGQSVVLRTVLVLTALGIVRFVLIRREKAGRETFAK